MIRRATILLGFAWVSLTGCIEKNPESHLPCNATVAHQYLLNVDGATVGYFKDVEFGEDGRATFTGGIIAEAANFQAWRDFEKGILAIPETHDLIVFYRVTDSQSPPVGLIAIEESKLLAMDGQVAKPGSSCLVLDRLEVQGRTNFPFGVFTH